MKNLTILCGGHSTEHDISLLSAQNVLSNIDGTRYLPTILYISPRQGWFRLCTDQALSLLIAGHALDDRAHFEPIVVSFEHAGQPWRSVEGNQHYACDAVFPVLHGYQGEDGCIQGLLTLLNLPYVGADLLASAILMNKIETKRCLAAADIPVVPFHALRAGELGSDVANQALKDFFGKHNSVFVKPACSGSSVGVFQVSDWGSLVMALKEASQYDEWLMVEPAMTGRELEVAVLFDSNEQLAAGPGEIIKPEGRFYDFDSKYVHTNLIQTTVAANLSESEKEEIKRVACQAVKVTNCEGMCRVDGFYQDNTFFINEVNTIPGFTNISLFPSMFAHEGLDTQQLVSRLVDYALKRQARLSKIKRDFALPKREKV